MKKIKITESQYNKIIKEQNQAKYELSSGIRTDIIDDLDNIPTEDVPMYLREVIEWCEELIKAYDGFDPETGGYEDDGWAPGAGSPGYTGDEDLGPM